MANQCKFGMGNCLFIPSSGNTCILVIKCVKLFSLQNHRPQRKRMEYSTVRSKWEGRARALGAKADTVELENRKEFTASPVSCQWHVMKAIYGKSGDPVVSMNMPRGVVK